MFIICWCIIKRVPGFQRIQSTGDVLLDLTGRNISDYLVKTYPSLIRTRYCHLITTIVLFYMYLNMNLICVVVLQLEKQVLGKWTKVLVSKLNICSRKYKCCPLWCLVEHINVYIQLPCIGEILTVWFLFFRYGGISVGGRLPVLDLDPKTIENVASQLGRLLNVTGVSCGVSSPNTRIIQYAIMHVLGVNV